MAVTRVGFSQVVGNGFAGFGFAPEAPTVYEFPLDMFVPGSDLTPISENIDKIVYGLTKWEPGTTTTGLFYPGEKVKAQGSDYQEAVANMNSLFLANMWGDGLPITPATEELVDWILTGTDLPRDTVVGKILPRGGIATVESIAVALAMAGGRPEYLPVLIASMQAIVDPAFVHQSWTATTSSVSPAVIVNGPIGKAIRLGSEYGCLGPDPIHPAGGSIGRAIRLMLQNLGGAIPGVGTMALYGGPYRYTNLVFAEDEAGIPKDWEPLNVELGFAPGSNTVTLYRVASAVNVCCGSVGTEETVLQYLYTYAGFMKIPNSNYFQTMSWNDGSPGVVLIADTAAQGFSDVGWSKEKVKEFLWENSRIPWDDIANTGRGGRVTERFGVPEGELVPITAKPENILIAVAGGAQGMHGYWMQAGCCEAVPVSREIALPANWEALLKQAEADLGPLPAN
jgi:hypothetical protein